MLAVMGIVFVFLSQGVTQVKEVRQYESLEACWKDANTVMQNEKSPYHMACVPVFIKGTNIGRLLGT